MITSCKILLTECTDPKKNLTMEEALLLSLPENTAILFLWQNAHTVVIGSGQNAWRECDVQKLHDEGGTLVRRSSGGGAVYHDLGNLNFSFIVPREDYDVDRQLRVVMGAVARCGLTAEKSGRNDLLIDGRKFSGNAFRLLKSSALHHGTLLIASDMTRVPRYLTPDASKLKAKGVKSVASRVTNLSELGDVDIERMTNAMIDAFMQEYGSAEIALADSQQPANFDALLAKYQSWDWNFGASPMGDVQIKTRFPWGGVEIIAVLEHGIIKTCRVFTDSMDETLAVRLETALIGCRWTGDDLAACTRAIGEEDVAFWLKTAA
jgi:lipoate-protein ligase A